MLLRRIPNSPLTLPACCMSNFLSSLPHADGPVKKGRLTDSAGPTSKLFSLAAGHAGERQWQGSVRWWHGGMHLCALQSSCSCTDESKHRHPQWLHNPVCLHNLTALAVCLHQQLYACT